MSWRNNSDDRRQSSARYGADWRRKREACLRAANWRCEIKIPGVCIHSASEVDHIIGAANDPEHRFIRAACKPCHRHVTSQQGHDARRGRRTADPAPQPREQWFSSDPPCTPRSSW